MFTFQSSIVQWISSDDGNILSTAQYGSHWVYTCTGSMAGVTEKTNFSFQLIYM